MVNFRILSERQNSDGYDFCRNFYLLQAHLMSLKSYIFYFTSGDQNEKRFNVNNDFFSDTD